MSNKVTVGFVMVCSKCDCRQLAGQTMECENEGKQQVAYYSAETWRLIGFSDGDGDSFVCLACARDKKSDTPNRMMLDWQ